MFKTLVFLASASVLVVFAADEVTRATVCLLGNGVDGKVTFTTQPDGKVRIQGQIKGMPPGMYGFHVHEKGDITDNCRATLGHFNPNGNDHGHPDDENRHVGDLGNIEFDKNGVANLDFVDPQIKLSGPHNIIGRGVVLHEKSDDFGRTDHPDSKKTGNAGGRVVCGVIGILASEPAGVGRSGTTNVAPAIMGTSLSLMTALTILL